MFLPGSTPTVGPFYLWRPTNEEIKNIQSSIPKRAFNFSHVGLTKNTPPLPSTIRDEWWGENHLRVQVGNGVDAYNKAVTALNNWQHFDLGWAFVYNKPPVKKNASVVVTAQSLFLWSCNPLKITYVDKTVTDSKQQRKRYSFGHTTVQGHQLAGEERFTLVLNKKDDSVWYEVYSISKPDNPIVWLAQPLLRFYQRKFAADSAKALKKQISSL